MRILIFSVAYEPLLGGAELAVRNVTDRLSFEFDLITCRLRADLPRQERIGNVNVFRVGFGGRLGRYLYPVFAYRLASRLHRERPYDVVWSIMAAYAGAAALMFLRRFPKTKFLLTLQEGDSIEHIHSRVRGFRRQWQRLFKRADRIQPISNFLADWARSEGATCPIDVVPNGVDLHNFQFPIFKFQAKSNSKIKIITVSRLVPKNGIDILIRAIARLKIHLPSPNFQLQILGAGPEEKRMKKLVEELKLQDMVEFKGEVSPLEVPQYLAQAQVFVRPSRSEGLGSAFLESMAAGVPVISTAVGGIPDFLKDHETGLLAKVEDPSDLAKKIQLLLEDEDLRTKLGIAGRKLVAEKYTWNSIAVSMENIFQKFKI